MNTTNTEPANDTANATRQKGLTRWLKRIGVAGFLFFLFKGIVWILVFAGAFRYLGCES